MVSDALVQEIRERAEILEGSPAEVAASLVGKIKELGLL